METLDRGFDESDSPVSCEVLAWEIRHYEHAATLLAQEEGAQ